MRKISALCAFILILCSIITQAQLNWTKDGNSYLTLESGSIVKITLPSMTKTTIVDQQWLVNPNNQTPFRLTRFQFSDDYNSLLFLTDGSSKYHNTYSKSWVLNIPTKKITEVGKGLDKEKFLNSKLSPDGTKVAFVYLHNIYVHDITTDKITQITKDGNEKLLNGYFDYNYSEEMFCTDGIRWSPDSKQLAFWQNDVSKIGTYYMVNNTDHVYPQLIPILFSKPGTDIAEARVGVANLDNASIQWMNIPGAPNAHYLSRMDWKPAGNELIVQQINRAQNHSKLWLTNAVSGSSKLLFEERDAAWIDVQAFWMRGKHSFDWIDNGKSLIWPSEKDGWRHLYKIDSDGTETLITKGNFDISNFNGYDEKNKWFYFTASPENATQRYLYRTKIDKNPKNERLSPANLAGTHSYDISPNGAWARHSFSSHQYSSQPEFLKFPDNKAINPDATIEKTLVKTATADQTSFFKVTTSDGIEIDGWMVKPKNFDPAKKYPVVFTTYSEPFSTTVNDVAGTGARGGFFNIEDGYIYISVEGRGAPALKGREWRKSIYKNLGWINANDQAMAAKEIIKWPFIDASRVAVFGSSGGGSTTLHLLFRYPEIYQTGLASAGVPSHYVYNSIYSERYLGLLPENKEAYEKGSALNYAKNLKGNLLIMHGTGDHNVHYQGEEMLINELVKHKKQFTIVPYPNRGHGISEGEGTRDHRNELMTNFLKLHCPPGGR